MDKELQPLMDEYKKKFDDVFPLFCCMGMSAEAIVAEIKKCIKQGKPFETEPEDVY